MHAAQVALDLRSAGCRRRRDGDRRADRTAGDVRDRAGRGAGQCRSEAVGAEGA
jgi:hypothetical protein